MKQLLFIGPDGLIFYDLVILPGRLGVPILNGAIFIRNDEIVDIGKTDEVLSRNGSVKRHSMAGYTVCPGFVNVHTHSPMSFFRGLGHDQSLPKNPGNSMIEDFFFPSEAKLTAELMEPLSYSYIVDGLKSGVTCFGDVYFFAKGICEALQRVGVRGAVGEHHADLGGPLPAGQDLWKKTKSWIENWEYSLVKPVVYGHAADTLSKSFLTELVEFSSVNGLPFHMHLSQTEGERDRVMKREGMSPVKFAESCGALKEKSLLVHLLSADEEDFKRIADSGATAGLCPISEILYEKAPDGKAMVDAGIPIALGTDCAASNDGSDVLNEAKFFGLMLRTQGVSHEHSSPDYLLDAITSNGAKAFDLPLIGCLEKGKKADLVFMRNSLISEPVSNPVVNLLYSMSAKNVDHVMVDGKWCLWNKSLVQVSETELRESFVAALTEVKKRTGLPIQI